MKNNKPFPALPKARFFLKRSKSEMRHGLFSKDEIPSMKTGWDPLKREFIKIEKDGKNEVH